MAAVSPPFDVKRFYRLGATGFVLTAVGRSQQKGLHESGWSPASGFFADPGEATGTMSDLLDDVLHAPTLNRDAMFHAAPVWLANTGATDAVLEAKVNAALTGAGYTRPNGTAIT